MLYNTLVSVFFPKNHPHILMDVAGITALLVGSTVLSRMPRLDKIIPGYLFGVAAFIGGALGYWFFASSIPPLLDSAFLFPNGLLFYFLAPSIVSTLLSKLKPNSGMKPLTPLVLIPHLIFFLPPFL